MLGNVGGLFVGVPVQSSRFGIGPVERRVREALAGRNATPKKVVSIGRMPQDGHAIYFPRRDSDFYGEANYK